MGSAEVKIPGKLMQPNSSRKRPHDLFTPKRDTPRRPQRQNQRRVRVNFHARLPLCSKRVPIRTQLHQTTEEQTTLRPVWHTTRPRVSSHQSRKLKKAVPLRMHTFTTVGEGHMNKLLNVRWKVPHETKKCTTSTMFCRSPTHS